MAVPKSVISLISYDAEFLPKSIKTYYDYVDEIILGLDKDRISWNQHNFSFDENKLWKELRELDVDNKITIIEETFHPSDVPMENDNYERNFLKNYCTNDWILSFDADEELVNPKDFFYRWCPLFEPYYKKYDIEFTWYLPWKAFKDVTLFITENDNSFIKTERQGFATAKNNHYTYARWTNNVQRIESPLAILHWSLCRKEKEIEQKLKNFSHADITEKDPFFNLWKQTTLDNYQNIKNFKTSGMGDPRQWPKLTPVPNDQIYKACVSESRKLYQ